MKLILDRFSNKIQGHIHEEITASISVVRGSFMHWLGGRSIRVGNFALMGR